MTAARPVVARARLRPTTSERSAVPPWTVVAVRLGAAAGAAVLAGTSTGSMVVAAALLAVALSDRRSAIAAGLVIAAVAVRFGTTTFDELAPLQSVLGSAVRIGPAAGAASAWLCMVALVLAAGQVPGDVRFGLGRHLPALASGTLAAAVAVGDGPGGDVWLRVAATAGVTVLAWLIAGDRIQWLSRTRRSWAVLAGVAAVVGAGWPS